MPEINCSIIRGGTSKAIFFLEEDLPPEGSERDAVIKLIMGTPDKRQINGLGGADILTSKIAIIGKPTHPDADIDYTFAQVGIEEDTVDYSGNCGNISAAVGPFAIEEGFITQTESVTKIKIHNTNINKIIMSEIPVKEGRPLTNGDFSIDGVPGTGAKIVLDFAKTAGSLTNKLFPTGNKIDTILIPGFGKISVSIVDLANPMVFIEEQELNLIGTETPAELEANQKIIKLCEQIRGIVAVKLGLASNIETAYEESPFIPFFCIVSKSTIEQQNNVDIQSRLIGFNRVHKAFPGTAGACLAVASCIPGTLAYNNSVTDINSSQLLRISHPSGTMNVDVQVDNAHQPLRAAFGRTWRRIMDGVAYY